jgi:hypothetical protein
VGQTAEHGAHIDLVIGRWGDGASTNDRMAVALDFRLMNGQASYMVVDAATRSASFAELAARSLRRDEVIGTPLAKRCFEVVDAVWAQEKRLGDLKTEPAGFVCATCGVRHPALPTAFTAGMPAAVGALPADNRDARLESGSDQCILDGERFFIRGNVDLPVEGRAEPLSWTLWIELGSAEFRRASELWLTEGRESEPAFAARLANDVPGYPPCVDLEVQVHTQPVGIRPRITVVGAGHPLADDQQHGLSAARADELAHTAMKG